MVDGGPRPHVDELLPSQQEEGLRSDNVERYPGSLVLRGYLCTGLFFFFFSQMHRQYMEVPWATHWGRAAAVVLNTLCHSGNSYIELLEANKVVTMMLKITMMIKQVTICQVCSMCKELCTLLTQRSHLILIKSLSSSFFRWGNEAQEIKVLPKAIELGGSKA